MIGSGILNALSIRNSNYIDVVVPKIEYLRLERKKNYTKTKNNGFEILSDGFFEIGTCWHVLEEYKFFKDLKRESVII